MPRHNDAVLQTGALLFENLAPEVTGNRMFVINFFQSRTFLTATLLRVGAAGMIAAAGRGIEQPRDIACGETHRRVELRARRRVGTKHGSDEAFGVRMKRTIE